MERTNLLDTVEALQANIKDCHVKATTIEKLIEGEFISDGDDIVNYLVAKQQLLLAYCTNLSFYSMLKLHGVDTADHPVMRKLIEHRYVMEKMKSLDTKMKNQVDRLLRYASTDDTADRNHASNSSLRPNVAAMRMVTNSDDSKKAANDEDKEYEAYRAPKFVAMRYEDDERQADKDAKTLRNKKRKLQYSEVMDSLKEEFGSMPEAISSSGMQLSSENQRKQMAVEKERRKFEEDNYRRLTLTRADKKAARKAERENSRFDSLLDLGHVGDMAAMADVSQRRRERGRNSEPSSYVTQDGANSLRKSLNMFKKQR